MKAFAIGFAWFVSLLSGIVTIFALFGGQQWLEAKGWTLDPNVQAVEQTTGTAADEADAATGGEEATADRTAEVTTSDAASDPGGTGADPQDNAFDHIDAIGDWLVDTGEGPFDNWFLAFLSVVVLTLFALTAGVLVADAYWNDSVRRFFDVIGAILLTSIAVYLGFIVGAIDPGWLAWYIIASVLASVVGFFVADGANY